MSTDTSRLHGGDATIIIAFRLSGDRCPRTRNLLACLTALMRQSLARHRYRCVLVEQGTTPLCPSQAISLVDEYVFAFNPGPFNRAWGFNIGARLSSTDALCLLDADLVVPQSFLARCSRAWQKGWKAFRPYGEILYLTPTSTNLVLSELETETPVDVSAAKYQGVMPRCLQGGSLWVDAALYASVNGHDERFEGWGDEDREFWQRLSKVSPIAILPGRLLHLYHPRQPDCLVHGKANRLLYMALKEHLLPPQRGPIGEIDRYRYRRSGD